MLKFLIIFTSIHLFSSSSFASTNLLYNGNFSMTDSTGTPTGWYCDCNGVKTNCAVNVVSDTPTSITLNPSCSLSSGARLLNQTDGASAQLEVIGTSINPDDFRLSTSNSLNEIEVGNLGTLTADGWTTVSIQPVSSAGITTVGLLLSNHTHNPVQVRNVSIYQNGPNPSPKVATVIHAIQDSIFYYSASSTPTALWFPLPLDHASQVPLSLHLTSNPQSIVQKIIYSKDAEGNVGATVTLSPQTASGNITVHWDATVLTRVIEDSERASVYQATENPSIWLQSSPMADATYPGISDLSKTFVSNSSNSSTTLQNIIQWTSQNVKYGYPLTSFTATDAFLSRQTECTGFAQLGAALGRAAQLPTRAMANIMVGMEQDTHWIDEFYLGTNLGWRRVEPQGTSPVIPEDYGVMLRKDLPTDEQVNFPSPGLPGLPLLALPASLSPSGIWAGSVYFSAPNKTTFAEVQATIRGDLDQMKSVFSLARTSWERDYGNESGMRRINLENISNYNDLNAAVIATSLTQ